MELENLKKAKRLEALIEESKANLVKIRRSIEYYSRENEEGIPAVRFQTGWNSAAEISVPRNDAKAILEILRMREETNIERRANQIKAL